MTNTTRQFIIRPENRTLLAKLREMLEFRDLFFFLTWRDITVRYRQTIIGAAWAIIQPITTMVVFTIFFGNLAQLDSDGVPYALFSFAALVPWQFFANSINTAANSMINNQAIIAKVYFPRMMVPLSAMLSNIVDLILSFAVLLVMIFVMGYIPTINVLWLPLLVLLAIVTATGVGLWLAALNVQFRDVRYIVPFITQVWLFITPIAYSSSLLDEPLKTLYGINPMAGVVEGFRWALLGTNTQPTDIVLVSAVVALLLMSSGAWYFNRIETHFADII